MNAIIKRILMVRSIIFAKRYEYYKNKEKKYVKHQ